MPKLTVAPTKVLSVCDIQGSWREKSSDKVWTVNGIVAEKTKQPRAHTKPVVLSDGPHGVEWGTGNLKGSLEDGCLVWRNRRGDATYFWEKLEARSEATGTDKSAGQAKQLLPITKPPPAPAKAISPTKIENQSPRSTLSDTSNETAEMTAGAGSLGRRPSNEVEACAFAEVKTLLAMAGDRLLAGDVYMSMKYIELAQQIQPQQSQPCSSAPVGCAE